MGAAPGAQPGTTRQIQPSAQLPHRQLEMDRAVRAQGRRGQFAASDVIGQCRGLHANLLSKFGFGEDFGHVRCDFTTGEAFHTSQLHKAKNSLAPRGNFSANARRCGSSIGSVEIGYPLPITGPPISGRYHARLFRALRLRAMTLIAEQPGIARVQW